MFGAALALLSACGDRPAALAVSPAAGTASPRAAALAISELKAGSGPAVAAGQKAVMRYTGWLYEAAAPDRKGREFDSTRSGQSFSFIVGVGAVIKGWDRGVLGMKVGERRRLTLPADLAYGDAGAGGVIPPGATLIFDVELIAIE